METNEVVKVKEASQVKNIIKNRMPIIESN